MKSITSGPMNETEQAFWKKVKGLVFSDTCGVVVMAVAVFISLVVMFF
jgi:hypothetical protein